MDSNFLKGQAGVYVLWPNIWNNQIKKTSRRKRKNCRYFINLKWNICLINTYMPTREPDSQYEYGDCLDIIHSIIEKYQSTHQVIVCGDLNGTLATSRNNKHDQLLKQFVLEMNLSTVGNYGEQNTFFHHSGQSSSQMNYLLTNNKDIYCNHEIWENTSSNVSSHRITRDIKIKDELDKEMDAIKVFQSVIQFLKDHLFKSISDEIKGIQENDLHYVLTAGIKTGQLSIALEPEAASIYCQHLKTDRQEDAKEKNAFAQTIKAGMKYMVVDLGGK
ncbi:unnamed protein product [Mytilus edulis]|uniref:Endonuclease/exonuclease/phosphatase domain-containing protein n=1 Tax=Mytilus edulis TaxID=6550 RepID=A0A8S3SYS3_MYTED|nr:unnamed protein product [Mytilus edulis]